MYDVVRNFGVDYIYFDLIFVSLFLFLMIIYKKKLALLMFFIGGFLINFFIDWGLWLHTGIREVSLPFEFTGSVFLFMLWFSLTYGVEYSYVFIMFENKSNKIGWTALVFLGWLSVAFLSQWLPVNDSSIMVVRHMNDFRLLRIVMVVFGYVLLFIFRYNWRKIAYLFLVGFTIHFMMEFSLFVSGIRPGSLHVLVENSLLEFNTGVPFFYLFYDKLLKKKFELP